MGGTIWEVYGMVTSEQTNKRLSWYIGIVVAKLPFGLKFFFFFWDKFAPLGDQKKKWCK